MVVEAIPHQTIEVPKWHSLCKILIPRRVSKFNKIGITLKYFGLIADITNTDESCGLEKSDYTSQDLINQLYGKY